MKLGCRECGVKLGVDEVSKAGNTCPSCGKETSWLSEPEFVGFD